jgi:hypothetical protein
MNDSTYMSMISAVDPGDITVLLINIAYTTDLSVDLVIMTSLVVVRSTNGKRCSDLHVLRVS